jgi:hypothetical protein
VLARIVMLSDAEGRRQAAARGDIPAGTVPPQGTGWLSRLLPDAGFLLAADPDRLLPALPVAATPREAAVVAIYQECAHQLREGPLECQAC